MNYVYAVVLTIASQFVAFFLGKRYGRDVEAELHDEKNKLIAEVKAKL